MMKKNTHIFFHIFLILYFSLFSFYLSAELTYWYEYGGMSWEDVFQKNLHSGVFSAKVYGPKSSLTYSFIYQVVQIDPTKTYCMNLWVSNVNINQAGGRFGFREDQDFTSSSFKATNSDEDYGEAYSSSGSGWTNLVFTNSPDTADRKWVKVGLRVSYSSGDTGLKAYFDDVQFYALDNPGKNLIQNGDFEYGWNYPDPPDSSKPYEIYAFPKIFTPKGYDKYCSINIKVNNINSHVYIELLSMKGISKKVFYSGVLSSTRYSILWNGRDDANVILPMGIYVLRMVVTEYENKIPTQKEYKSVVVLGNNLK